MVVQSERRGGTGEGMGEEPSTRGGGEKTGTLEPLLERNWSGKETVGKKELVFAMGATEGRPHGGQQQPYGGEFPVQEVLKVLLRNWQEGLHSKKGKGTGQENETGKDAS